MTIFFGGVAGFAGGCTPGGFGATFGLPKFVGRGVFTGVVCGVTVGVSNDVVGAKLLLLTL